MKQIAEIARKETKVLFYSPIGWLILFVFSIQLGSLLSSNLTSRAYSVWNISEITTSLTYNILFGGGKSIIPGIAGELYLYIPLLTMGLLSREYNEGTIKLLLSSPLRVRDILLGKYLSMVIYAGVLVGFIGFLGILMSVFVIDKPDIGLYVWALFLLFLVICAYASIGLYISSLTSYQFVAALGAVGVLFLLNYASRLSAVDSNGFISTILSWLNGFSFLYVFKGYIGSWEISFFLLVIIFFIGLSYLRLQSLREPRPWRQRLLRVLLLLTFVFTIGYASSRPGLKYYVDVRRAEVKDTKIMIARSEIPRWRFILMQGIPLLLLAAGSVLVIRRGRQ